MPYKSRKPKSKPLQPKSRKPKSRKPKSKPKSKPLQPKSRTYKSRTYKSKKSKPKPLQPKSRNPKSRKHKSKRHKSKRHKSKRHKSKRHKSKKHKSRKPKSRKPKSRKPKSNKNRKYKINEICHGILDPPDVQVLDRPDVQVLDRPDVQVLDWTFGPGQLIHFTTNRVNGERIKRDGFVKTASITGAEGLGGHKNTTWWLPYCDVNDFKENPEYGVSESNIFEDMEYGIDAEIQYEENLIRFQENGERVFDNEDHLNNTMFFTNTVDVNAVIEPNPSLSLRVEICTQTPEIPVVDVTDFILQHIDHDNVILNYDDDDENSMDDDDENSMDDDEDEDSEYSW